MNTSELILSSLILQRARDLRGVNEGKTDVELIDIAITELSSFHGEIQNKLTRQISEISG